MKLGMKKTVELLLIVFSILCVMAGTAYAQGEGKHKAGDHGDDHADAPAKHAKKKDAAKGAEKEAEPVAAPAAAAAATHDDEKEEKPHGPQTIHIGVALEKLGKFELGPGSYNAELILSLRCEHEPCKPDFDVSNGKVTGKEKLFDEKLEKSFRVKAELDAIVDLSEFPFDKHVLLVNFVDKGDPLNTKYVIDEQETGLDPSIKLAGWEIASKLASHVETHKLEGHEIQEAQFGIAIQRPRLAAFGKTLLPVCFMIFVAGFTLLLKPKSASGRLSAATAGLMTVVMFHISSTSSLPPLGYLTRMDKFMIATYLVYLINIALAVAIVRFDEKKNEKMAELTYLTAGGLVPGVALLAWLTVFLRIA